VAGNPDRRGEVEQLTPIIAARRETVQSSGLATQRPVQMSVDRVLARRLLPLLDLTCLDEAATPAVIAGLCARANGPHGEVAALCVYSEHVEHARASLPKAIAVASVVNFPDGGEDATRVAREIARLRAVGADEIDAVLPWRALVRGDEKVVVAVLRAAREASRGMLLKVILESGELESPDTIRRAAELALAAGADFLKTSTGKARVGATLPAAEVMLSTIRAHGGQAGFKAAGGIKTLDQAGAYLGSVERTLGPMAVTPGRFRIGASSMLDAIEARLTEER
jgi:deoxyribose-phosphate aldolase